MATFHRLALLNRDPEDWCIRVKILRNYYCFSTSTRLPDLWLIFADERGARINATVATDFADDYVNVLEEGKWKIIKNFDVSFDDAPWRPLRRAYKITITKETEISDSPQISSNIFATFATFDEVIDGSIGTDFLIELVGKVSTLGKLKHNPMDPDVIEAYRMQFSITDMDGQVIKCLALDSLALEFAEEISNAGGGDVIIVLRWWKVYQISPDRFGVHSQSSISQFLINPAIPEVEELRGN